MASEPIPHATPHAQQAESHVRGVLTSIVAPLIVAAIVALTAGYLRDRTTDAAYEQRLQTVEAEQKKLSDYHETLIRLDERLLSIDRRLERIERGE